MATYFYQATDTEGRIIEGDLDAPDYRVAVQKVRGLNYFPIKVTQEEPDNSFFKGLSLQDSLTSPFSKISAKELMSFTQQLATLTSSKLTLDKSLSITTRLTEKEKARETFQDIQKRVHGGSSFADALAAYPEVFSKMYVNIIRAGELGGVLDSVLMRLGDFLERVQDTKSKIVNAMIYPAILISFGGGAILFLMIFVVPKFSSIFEDKGNAIPFVTMILLNLSNFLVHNWWMIGAVSVFILIAFIVYAKSPIGKYYWDKLVLKLPIFGDLVRKIEMSRFSRTMATLLNSGVPVLQALNVVQSVINNRVIATAIAPLQEGLKSGQGISRSLQKADTFPPLAVHMIVVGEETGELEDMLIKVADTYDKEVDNAIRRALAMLGPFLLLSVGGTVIFIVFSIFLGMFSVTDLIM